MRVTLTDQQLKSCRSQMLRLCATHHGVYRAGEHWGDFAHQLETESQNLSHPSVQRTTWKCCQMFCPHRVHLFLLLTKAWDDQYKSRFVKAQKNYLTENTVFNFVETFNKNYQFDMFLLLFFFVLKLSRDCKTLLWFCLCFILGPVWARQH